MRKLTISFNGRIFETEVTDEEFNRIAGLDISTTKKPSGISRSMQEPKTDNLNTSSARSRVKKLIKNPDQWSVIARSVGESPARGNRKGANYALMQNKETQELVGQMLTANGHTEFIYLGTPTDPQSKVSLIKKAVASMPYYDAFARRNLTESLPGNIAGRGELLKFAFDYLEKIGMVVKLKEKDPSTRAILYKRLDEKGNAPAARSVEEGAEAIPR